MATDETAQIKERKPIDEKLQRFVDEALHGGGSETAQNIRNCLNGTWLGEPLHVVLTDLPLGAWTVALIFDGLDAVRSQPKYEAAADVSIGIGLLGAAGAALTGLADWSDVDPPARRVGMWHGLLNVSATVLFASSLVSRKRRLRKQGRIYAAAGYAAMLVAAKLGGDMVYKHRVGVDRTSGESFPEKWVAVLDESELQPDTPAHAAYDGAPVLLVRRGERVFALAETCSHFGAPLSEGKLVEDSIVCPWHASRFSLADGHVINGPAVHPQPCLEVRSRNGKIEVRKPSSNGKEPAIAVEPVSVFAEETNGGLE